MLLMVAIWYPSASIRVLVPRATLCPLLFVTSSAAAGVTVNVIVKSSLSTVCC